MVGLCGVIGNQNQTIEQFSETLCYQGNEEVATYSDDLVSIAYVDHKEIFSKQPFILENDEILLWIWGVVIGHEHKDEYRVRSSGLSNEEYYSGLYDQYGLSFISGLNSEFAGVIYNKNDRTFSIFTDRLSTRPIYYTYADDGSFVFSTQIQSFRTHPHITLIYDTQFLSEFLNYGRVLGTYTPIADVRQLPPASITTINKNGVVLNEHIYWWPNQNPVDLTYSEFVSRFEKAFSTAVSDRIISSRDYGLLLSAGNDCRAILSILGTDVVGFHMNEQLKENHEALAAKKVANEAGIEFKLLKRDQNYYPSILEKTGPLTNFNGIFRHSNAVGFAEEISNSVDYLFCGQYSDTLINLEKYVPMNGNNVQNIKSPAEYATSFENGEMGGHIGEKPKKIPFVKDIEESAAVIERHVNNKGTYVESHGVKYPSWDSLIQFGMSYPITNVRTFVFYETNVQMTPTHYPYFDNRILDIILKMPNHIRHQNQIVDDVLSNIDPYLASLPSNPTPSRIKPYLDHIRNTPITQLPIDGLKYCGILEGSVKKSTAPSQTYIKKDHGRITMG